MEILRTSEAGNMNNSRKNVKEHPASIQNYLVLIKKSVHLMYIPECKHRLYLYKILVYTHSNYQNIKERLCLQKQHNKLQN